jgi:hypothetical protein
LETERIDVKKDIALNDEMKDQQNVEGGLMQESENFGMSSAINGLITSTGVNAIS